MKQKIVYLFSILCLWLCSCKKENTTDIIQVFNLPAFEEVEVSDAFDIYLTQDSIYGIHIEGDELFTQSVEYKVENKKLSLRSNSNKKWLHPKSNKVKIYIHADSLKFIKANETCFIRTTTPIVSHEFGIVMAGKLNMAELELNCNTFYYWNNHPCGGKLTLKGETQNLKIWNTAIMTVDAGNLTTQYALIENNSQGDCEVRATNILEYSIGGSGNVNLYGSPPQIILLKDYTSTGRLKQF